MPGLYNTGFIESDGFDLGQKLVEKSYLLDVYGGLIDTFKTPGLMVWGRNDYGQLGNNATAHKSSPVQTIAGGTNWKQVSAGAIHTAAIKSDGTLWLWGGQWYGELGDNTGSTSRSSPVQTITSGTNWKQVSAGGYFTAAIKTNGELWTWGDNTYGQLGNNATGNQSSPVQTICSGTNWKQVSAGESHTAAIKTDGTLWTMGFSTYGQLGNNATAHKSSPVQTICSGTNWKQVSCWSFNSAAIKTNGELWLWGQNDYGQLGDNTITQKSSPVQTIASGTNWKQVSLGDYHTVVIKTDNTLWLWGRNSTGALGDNGGTDRSSPVQTVCSGTNWKQISARNFNNAAIKTDGTLWTWGANNYGQLGDNSSTHRSSPVQTICSGTNWKQVSAGDDQIIAIRDFDF